MEIDGGWLGNFWVVTIIYPIVIFSHKIASLFSDDEDEIRRNTRRIISIITIISMILIIFMVFHIVTTYEAPPTYEEKYPLEAKQGVIEDIKYHPSGFLREEYYEITYEDGTIHRYDEFDYNIREGQEYIIEYRDDSENHLNFEGYEEVE